MSNDKKISIRLDEKTLELLERLAGLKGMSTSEAVRDLITSRGNEFSTELNHVSTATNLTAMEAIETRKHVAKISEILASKLTSTDKSIEAVATKLATIEKNNEVIADLLVKIFKTINTKG